MKSYRNLARALDALPNRFPPAEDGSDLRLLAKLFTPEEADLAACLLPELETSAQIAERLGRDPAEVNSLLKDLTKKNLIQVGRTAEGRLGFALMPFVVGFYEEQTSHMDAEMAQLFEDYFQQAFGRLLSAKPQLHRVVPVGVSVKNSMEVQPYETVTGLIDQFQSWGVTNCICRIQKALIGDPCKHPVEICMVLQKKPDAFASRTDIRALTRQGALDTLQRAAEAGLVHTVSNNQQDVWYICNCCTCSCGLLRGMVEMGVANVVAHSAFLNTVNADLCIGCGDCISACPFEALTLEITAVVNETRCAGCGVCILACPQDALELVRRPAPSPIPPTARDWKDARQAGL